MSTINVSNTKQITAYIISIFIIASILFVPPLLSMITFGVSYLIILFFLINSSLPLIEKNSNYINSSFSFIFAVALSHIVYNFYLENHINTLRLLEINNRLEQLENNKTIFFTNVSHELKTPLNIIYTAQQLLIKTAEADGYSNEKYFKYMKMIKQNTNRLARLIGNLIDITKIDSSCFKIKCINIDIIKVVEDITLSAATYIENNGLTLIFDTDTEEKVIYCDPDKIERIMLNLLSNALKFTNSGGTITVKMNCTDEEILIHVTDTGIGIPENMIDSIFDRYTQIDKYSREKEGSGIGLALVKSLVELHGGNIYLQSILDKGSTFTISLPNITNTDNTFDSPQSSYENKVDKVHLEFSDVYD